MSNNVEERIKKAQAALRKVREEEVQKAFALQMYKGDQMAAEMYHLPFRLLHSGVLRESGEVEPNRYYPAPGRRKMTAAKERILENVYVQLINDDEVALTDEEREVLAEADRIEAKDRVLNDDNMDYYMTHFLRYVDFEAYGPADWTGDALDFREAMHIKQDYMARWQDFKEHPEKYFSEPNPLSKYSGRKYDLSEV